MPPLSPLRPPLSPPVATPAAKPATVGQAAQRAFFEIAAGKAPSTPAAAQTSAPRIAPVASSASAASPGPTVAADRPAKILRPGSLLDIRV